MGQTALSWVKEALSWAKEALSWAKLALSWAKLALSWPKEDYVNKFINNFWPVEGGSQWLRRQGFNRK